MYPLALRCILMIELALVKMLGALVPRKKLSSANKILLTGNFYSEAWIRSQLEVFTHSEKVSEVFMVAENKVPVIDKVTPLYAPLWLNRLVGKDIARLIYFGCVAIKMRPQVLGGFHLLLNGLFAIFFARLVGARAVYVCGGGIREVKGGGYTTENRVFGRLRKADMNIEKLLCSLVQCCDYVVVRGTKARDFFVQEGGVAPGSIHIITAGIDTERFKPVPAVEKNHDLVFVGRISEVKRLHLVVEALALLQEKRKVNLLVVGDGPGRSEIEELANRLGVTQAIEFAGWQAEVEKFLNSSRLFLLTSSSEGLSQAMLQAMLCGLPALVSDVGDLADVVKDGQNGYLLEPCEPALIADRVLALLENQGLLEQMAVAARQTALDYDIKKVGARWDNMLS